MREHTKFDKSYESRKYGNQGKALGRSNGRLTPAPDSLSKRKEPGHLVVDAKTTIPHTRGCECYMHAEKTQKKMDY